MLNVKVEKIHKLLFKVSGVWISEALTLVTLFIIQMLSVKFLGLTEYGLFAALYSIITVFTSLSHGVRLAFAKTVARRMVEKDGSPFNLAEVFLPMFGGALSTLGLIGVAPLVFIFLDFTQYELVILLSLNFPFIVLVYVMMGVMQGSQNFKSYSFMVLFQSISRLVLVAIGLFFDLGIAGILGSTLLSNVLTVIICFPLCFRKMRDSGDYGNFANSPLNFGVQLSFLVVALMVSLHATVDVFWGRHALSAQSAGDYATIALLGKVVLYSPMAIIFVVFPKMVSVANEIRNVRNLFIKSIALTSCMSLGMTGILFFGTEIFGRLIIGPFYSLDSLPVFLYCLAMILLGISYQIFSLFLALSVNKQLIYRSAGLFIFGFLFLGVFGYSESHMSGLILALNFVILIQLCPATIKLFAANKKS